MHSPVLLDIQENSNRSICSVSVYAFLFAHPLGMETKKPNYAFVDGQNLYLSTAKATEHPWTVDLGRLKTYLKDKYKVSRIYYFLGYMQDENVELYTRLQELGYIVIFKNQIVEMTTKKKGNIDSDLIFRVMEKLIEEGDEFGKILLISGDGDFKILVDFLIKKDKFLKILLPNRKFASSLYKEL